MLNLNDPQGGLGKLLGVPRDSSPVWDFSDLVSWIRDPAQVHTNRRCPADYIFDRVEHDPKDNEDDKYLKAQRMLILLEAACMDIPIP
jgi:hypothetical protein